MIYVIGDINDDVSDAHMLFHNHVTQRLREHSF